jgi:hypothetical protein
MLRQLYTSPQGTPFGSVESRVIAMWAVIRGASGERQPAPRGRVLNGYVGVMFLARQTYVPATVCRELLGSSSMVRFRSEFSRAA